MEICPPSPAEYWVLGWKDFRHNKNKIIPTIATYNSKDHRVVTTVPRVEIDRVNGFVEYNDQGHRKYEGSQRNWNAMDSNSRRYSVTYGNKAAPQGYDANSE